MKPIRTIETLADMSNFSLKKMVAAKKEHHMEKWYGRAVLIDKIMLDRTCREHGVYKVHAYKKGKF